MSKKLRFWDTDAVISDLPSCSSSLLGGYSNGFANLAVKGGMLSLDLGAFHRGMWSLGKRFSPASGQYDGSASYKAPINLVRSHQSAPVTSY